MDQSERILRKVKMANLTHEKATEETSDQMNQFWISEVVTRKINMRNQRHGAKDIF